MTSARSGHPPLLSQVIRHGPAASATRFPDFARIAGRRDLRTYATAYRTAADEALGELERSGLPARVDPVDWVDALDAACAAEAAVRAGGHPPATVEVRLLVELCSQVGSVHAGDVLVRRAGD